MENRTEIERLVDILEFKDRFIKSLLRNRKLWFICGFAFGSGTIGLVYHLVIN